MQIRIKYMAEGSNNVQMVGLVLLNIVLRVWVFEKYKKMHVLSSIW